MAFLRLLGIAVLRTDWERTDYGHRDADIHVHPQTHCLTTTVAMQDK